MKTTSGLAAADGGLRGRQLRRLGLAAAICTAIAAGVATHVAPAAPATPGASAAHPYLVISTSVVISTSGDVTGGPGTV